MTVAADSVADSRLRFANSETFSAGLYTTEMGSPQSTRVKVVGPLHDKWGFRIIDVVHRQAGSMEERACTGDAQDCACWA
jgi:hypothetical protein